MDINFLKNEGWEWRGATLNEYTKWDPKKYRIQLAHVIITNKLPFKVVEGKGLQSYSKCLKFGFKIYYYHTIVKDVLKVHYVVKYVVMRELVGQRVCLTTNT